MSFVIQKLFNTQMQTGLLAMAPFFLIIPSYKVGMSIGLIAFCLMFVLTSALYLLRDFIPSQQRVVVVLLFSVSLVLIDRMLLQANAYSVFDSIGLFFPLLLINSLVLSLGEDVFSEQSYKSVAIYASGVAMPLLIFFILFGFLKDLLDMFSIIESSAGNFILLGLLFAAMNSFKSNKVTD
ncbi:MAG: hypothetical protein DHS20C09_01350 [marine bacterium B5-7]|nr:MAG: hypothetical protein DHS20C09_01350 [marine bacterium B5-7]